MDDVINGGEQGRDHVMSEPAHEAHYCWEVIQVGGQTVRSSIASGIIIIIIIIIIAATITTSDQSGSL